ncbi:hypothetical protein Goshw_000126 [Gossypium schwendimanii]|uniref:Uncharacterized protein n=1 Tax=Gossypium schwendimanii TaxID=34291 RepID=A0A7J9KPG4_GOSSC|nr:hypothetical protein [Gossypium schwendimanii]
MARLSIVLIIFLFSFIIQAPSSAEARKLMMNLQETAEALPLNKNVASVEQREPTPAVSFRNKDHEMVDEERLFALHLAKIDRILQSVPSPGAGH